MQARVFRYSFVTTWLLDTRRERVFEVVRDFERWPEWWPGVEGVAMLDGTVMEQRWRSPMRYPVTVRARIERIGAPELIEGRVDGSLNGRGRCRLAERPGGGTHVRFELEVETTKRWMRLLAPIARPVFAWNHDRLMRRGGEGIARRLGTTVYTERSGGRRGRA